MTHPFLKLKALEPIATERDADTRPLDGIRGVIFDVYGTLIISASGDIGSQDLKGHLALNSLREAGLTWEDRGQRTEQQLGQRVVAEFERQIHLSHQKSKDQGIPYPEVNIAHIWECTVESLEAERGISLFGPDEEIDFREVAMHFEVGNNAVYPMPQMEEVLKQLGQADLELGIVSNAQFFTPMVLNHFMSQPLGGTLPYFNSQLQVYSYELGRAKPDTYLYEVLAQRLAPLELAPQQCLYIGNDMLNDIYPAQKVGFKTALFAGDQRSLRLREKDARCQNLKPDRVITQLEQILSILSI